MERVETRMSDNSCPSPYASVFLSLFLPGQVCAGRLVSPSCANLTLLTESSSGSRSRIEHGKISLSGTILRRALLG